MVATPETADTGTPTILNAPTRNPTDYEERAGLQWGDEAPTSDTIVRLPRLGQSVLCSDGYAGRVVSWALDGSAQLRGVAVRLGRLWGRQVSVPAGWIQSYDRTTMRLGIDRSTLHALPTWRTDAELAAAARRALATAGVLQSGDYGHLSVTASAGTVTLSGHVGASADRPRAERALHELPGVLEVQNDLVADDDLVNLVSQALARDEGTRNGMIFVAVSRGVVILSGLHNSARARAAAEECAARVPFVRGVSNYTEAPGTVVDAVQERVVQPRVGQEVVASDMSLGHVAQVIIDPRNRRVVAIVVEGQFPDRRGATPRMRSYEMPMEERSLVIPITEMGFVTPTVVQLSIDGIAAAGHHDFASEDFIQPDRAWRPPHPYAKHECLWMRP